MFHAQACRYLGKCGKMPLKQPFGHVIGLAYYSRRERLGSCKAGRQQPAPARLSAATAMSLVPVEQQRSVGLLTVSGMWPLTVRLGLAVGRRDHRQLKSWRDCRRVPHMVWRVAWE